MKIQETILEVLGGRAVMISQHSIRKVDKRLPQMPVTLMLKGTDWSKRCVVCDKLVFDYCWNCERPFCKDHLYYVKLVGVPILNSFCKGCKKELLKLKKEVVRVLR